MRSMKVALSAYSNDNDFDVWCRLTWDKLRHPVKWGWSCSNYCANKYLKCALPSPSVQQAINLTSIEETLYLLIFLPIKSSRDDFCIKLSCLQAGLHAKNMRETQGIKNVKYQVDDKRLPKGLSNLMVSDKCGRCPWKKERPIRLWLE